MQLDVITAGLDEENKKFFMDAYEFASGGKGKKLSPFGMSEAGAASQMQQMGGGDVFGAVAFTPLERIAKATEETAQNTKPDSENPEIQRPQDTLTK